ncbi:MAG: hypothetical protein ACXADF_18865 [Candidatus Thorarchaeota archaeon]|jgi:hypothetical protein
MLRVKGMKMIMYTHSEYTHSELAERAAERRSKSRISEELKAAKANDISIINKTSNMWSIWCKNSEIAQQVAKYLKNLQMPLVDDVIVRSNGVIVRIFILLDLRMSPSSYSDLNACAKAEAIRQQHLAELEKNIKNYGVKERPMDETKEVHEGEYIIKDKNVDMVDEQPVGDSDIIQNLPATWGTTYTAKHLQKHIQAILKRKETVDAEIFKLGQELGSLAMYLGERTIIVENCKFAVELVKSDNYHLRIYLKNVNKDDGDKLTWQDIISEVGSEPGILGTKLSKIKHNWLGRLVKGLLEPNIRQEKIPPALLSVILDRNFRLCDGSYIPNSMIRLLPAARMLVKEQLSLMYDAAQDDIEYIQQWPLDDEEAKNDYKRSCNTGSYQGG